MAGSWGRRVRPYNDTYIERQASHIRQAKPKERRRLARKVIWSLLTPIQRTAMESALKGESQ